MELILTFIGLSIIYFVFDGFVFSFANKILKKIKSSKYLLLFISLIFSIFFLYISAKIAKEHSNQKIFGYLGTFFLFIFILQFFHKASLIYKKAITYLTKINGQYLYQYNDNEFILIKKLKHLNYIYFYHKYEDNEVIRIKELKNMIKKQLG